MPQPTTYGAQLRAEGGNQGRFWGELDRAVKRSTMVHFQAGWHTGKEALIDISKAVAKFAQMCPCTATAMYGMCTSPWDERPPHK